MKNRQAVTVRIRREVWDRLEAESEELKFATPVEILHARLKTSFAKDGQPIPESITSTERDKGLKLDNERKEIELAVQRGELTKREIFMAEVRKAFSQIRQRIHQINLDGMTDEQRDQLDKAKEDCMTDLSKGLPDEMEFPP